MDLEKRIGELLQIRGTGDRRAEAMRQLATEVANDCASVPERMRPFGGRAWTDEQLACYEALSDAARIIREKYGLNRSENKVDRTA